MLDELLASLASIFAETRAERRRCNKTPRTGRRRWWAPWTRHPHPTTPTNSNR
ncbi:hypothetical protein [Streptomyces pseudogriseolus]|uniref:hypothetical protein n=1 Tax=Streptomyces pseudogriseolus TaxID=36817 RepID=UPI003FA1AED0